MSSPSCPLCGEAVRPVDLDFCPSCGAALAGPEEAEPPDLATHQLVDRVIEAARDRAEEVRAARISALAAALADASDGRQMVGIEVVCGSSQAILGCGVIVDAVSAPLFRATATVAIRAPFRLGDAAPSLEMGFATKEAGWRFSDVRDGAFLAMMVRELDPHDEVAVGELVDALKLLFDAWGVPGNLGWAFATVDLPADPSR